MGTLVMWYRCLEAPRIINALNARDRRWAAGDEAGYWADFFLGWNF
jgi:hypothetical protein